MISGIDNKILQASIRRIRYESGHKMDGSSEYY